MGSQNSETPSERLDRELDRRETERYLANIMPGALASSRESYLQVVRHKINRRQHDLSLLPANDSLRSMVEEELANLERQLTQLNAKLPINRRGLAKAWEAIVGHGDRAGMLGALNDNYRAWRNSSRFKDSSLTATKIVFILARELRANGTDVTRFGVHSS
jgi:hypothetical protein